MPRTLLKQLPGEALAGAVTAVLLVPQALAYALLAGMPPQAGLFAAMAPAFVYAIFGSSPALSVGPVAVVSLMTASTLGPLAAAGSPAYAQAALVIALLSGMMLAALGLTRLGVLINFLSYPVISGFTMGAAGLIVLSQAPQILGLRLTAAGNALGQAARLLQGLAATSPLTVLIGGASMTLLLLARGPLPRWLTSLGLGGAAALAACRSAPLLVVLAASAAANGFNLAAHGVQLVGHLDAGIPPLQPPDFPLEQWRSLLGPAALIGLVGYVEGISIAQVLGRQHRHEVSANRELLAVGLANIAAALTHAMPVAGSLSRSVVNDAAGARTRMAGLVTAILVTGASLVLGRVLESLPRAVLAAVIMVAVIRLLDWRPLLRLWHYDRSDAASWIITTAGVLLAGAELGFLAGLVLSLLQYIWRTANPHIVEVGRVPHSDLFVEADRHHELDQWPQILLVRIDESLFFGNAAAVQGFVIHKLSSRPAVTDVILICSAVNAIDTSALQMLEDLVDSLALGGVTVHLAEVKGPVMDKLARSSLLERLGRRQLHASTSAAVLSLAAPPI